jgi:hypothetical protein
VQTTFRLLSVATIGTTVVGGEVSCPAGKKVTGGGVTTAQPGSTHDTTLQIMESIPDTSLSSWHGAVLAPQSSYLSSFTVWAICATAS